jgi:hypothetical protein
MAQERVQIRLDAVDNTKRALTGLRGGLDKVKTSVFNLRNAFIGIGAGLAIKGFVNAGIQIENLGVQLKALLGSAKAGQKALKQVTDFAATTPFELSNIQQGVSALATVKKTAEEAGISFEELLKITGNTAVQLGGDFALASQQIQRSFSAGIGSADLFRDKAVTAMAGFSAGVKVSVDESIQGLRKAFGTGGEFGNLTEELSKTLSGTISNLKDGFFNFQVAVSAGFFTELKKELGNLKKFISDNDKEIKQFGVSVGQGLSRAIVALGKAVKFIGDNFEAFKKTLIAIIAIKIASFILTLTRAMIGLNIAMLANPLFMGASAVALVVTGIYSITNAMKDAKLATDKWARSLEYIDLDAFDKAMGMTKEDDIVGILKRPRAKPFFEDDEDDKVGDVISDKNVNQVEEFVKKIKDLNDNQMVKLKESFATIGQTLAVGIFNSIDAISKTLAESIILGKNLGDAFKKFVQGAIVNALGSLISFVIKKLFLYALEKLFPAIFKQQDDLEKKKLGTMKKQTSELMKQIALQLILSALGGGGGFGFAEGGRVNGTRANGGQTQNGNSYIVGERGRELFIPSTDGQIVSNENLNGMGATNINFTVQATDVKGVQELLIDNRATITNIINTALNQKGKPALV